MTVTVLTRESLFEVKHAILNALRESMERRPEEPKKWLLTSEVKYLLQISTSTLQELRIGGTLKYCKTGGIVYYDYEHIKKLLEQQVS